MLADIRGLHKYYQPLLDMDKALVCYEYDSPTTLTCKALGAFGYMMASLGVQIAAYFTYTPIDVAAYNPGWIVHYLNLHHTPNKGVALAAAGEIFRNTPFNAPISDNDELWENDYYQVDIHKDLVKYNDHDMLLYSTDLDGELDSTPKYIMGIGNSYYVQHEGNGCYILEYISEDILSLTVMPNQLFVNDPFRGKSFRKMANRYVNTNGVGCVSSKGEGNNDENNISWI